MEPAPLLNGKPQTDKEGNPVMVQRFYAADVYDNKGNKCWAKNDDPTLFADPPNIVPSDQELDRMFNPGSGPEPKFQRIHVDNETGLAPVTNAPPAALINDGLEKMTIRQLQELAAGEEIDLHGETTKQVIIDIIRSSR